MQLIQHVTVGAGGAASITFSGIPQTFTDLYLVVSLRSAASNEDFGISLNGSTSSFSNNYLFGNGSGPASGTVYGNLISAAPTTGFTANTFSNAAVYIPRYRSANNKSLSVDTVSENNATRGIQLINAILWSQTAAINTIGIYQLNSNAIVQHSSASLYGITAGSSGGVTVS